MRSLLVTFSGLDGAGKSTQIERVLAELRAQGLNPVYLWTRGGYTPVFSALKTLMRRATRGRMLPQAGPSEERSRALGRPAVRRAWLTLAILDLLWVFGLQVRWWQARGRPVVCDRYLWDTWIDFCLSFPGEDVERWRLWQTLVRLTPRPDAAFLIVLPVDESVRRLQLKREPYPTPPEVLVKRLARYEQLAAGSKASGWAQWLVLDGLRPADEQAMEIRACLAGMAQRTRQGEA
jgi:dTMP kinase